MICVIGLTIDSLVKFPFQKCELVLHKFKQIFPQRWNQQHLQNRHKSEFCSFHQWYDVLSLWSHCIDTGHERYEDEQEINCVSDVEVELANHCLSIETMPWLFCFLRQQLRRFVVLIEVVEDVKVDDDFWQPNTYPDEAHKRNPEGLLCFELGCRSSLYVVQ